MKLFIPTLKKAIRNGDVDLFKSTLSKGELITHEIIIFDIIEYNRLKMLDILLDKYTFLLNDKESVKSATDFILYSSECGRLDIETYLIKKLQINKAYNEQ